VHWAGRGVVHELGHDRHDSAPGGSTIKMAGARELVSTSRAFLEGPLAAALEHQLCRQMSISGITRPKCTAAVDKGLRVTGWRRLGCAAGHSLFARAKFKIRRTTLSGMLGVDVGSGDFLWGASRLE
jgi:hypothetical protein